MPFFSSGPSKRTKAAISELYKKLNSATDEDAVKILTQVLKLDPNHESSYTNRGYHNRKIGNLDAALADFSKAITLDPTFYLPYLHRGIVYAALSNYDSALSDFNIAVQLNPNEPSSYKERGLLLLSLHQEEKAKLDLYHAISLYEMEKLKYDNPSTQYYYIGIMQRRLHEYTDALYNLSRAIELGETDHHVFYERGEVYLSLGRLPEAVLDFQKANRKAGDKAPQIYRDVLEITQTSLQKEKEAKEIKQRNRESALLERLNRISKLEFSPTDGKIISTEFIKQENGWVVQMIMDNGMWSNGIGKTKAEAMVDAKGRIIEKDYDHSEYEEYKEIDTREEVKDPYEFDTSNSSDSNDRIGDIISIRKQKGKYVEPNLSSGSSLNYRANRSYDGTYSRQNKVSFYPNSTGHYSFMAEVTTTKGQSYGFGKTQREAIEDAKQRIAKGEEATELEEWICDVE